MFIQTGYLRLPRRSNGPAPDDRNGDWYDRLTVSLARPARAAAVAEAWKE